MNVGCLCRVPEGVGLESSGRGKEVQMATPTGLEALRELAEFRAVKGCALSLYLDLEPQATINPGDVQTRVHSLLDGGSRNAHFDSATLSREQKLGLKEDVERIQQYFASDFVRT